MQWLCSRLQFDCVLGRGNGAEFPILHRVVLPQDRPGPAVQLSREVAEVDNLNPGTRFLLCLGCAGTESDGAFNANTLYCPLGVMPRTFATTLPF